MKKGQTGNHRHHLHRAMTLPSNTSSSSPPSLTTMMDPPPPPPPRENSGGGGTEPRQSFINIFARNRSTGGNNSNTANTDAPVPASDSARRRPRAEDPLVALGMGGLGMLRRRRSAETTATNAAGGTVIGSGPGAGSISG